MWQTLKNREEDPNGEAGGAENDSKPESEVIPEPSTVDVVNTEMAQVHAKKNSHRMFLDDVEYLSFVRRLSWSPDGSFFLTPASVFQDLSSSDSGPVTAARSVYTVYGFLKSDITQPAFMLPGIKSYATCIRFNPYLYQKKNIATPDKPALLDLPYRIVFAVGTTE